MSSSSFQNEIPKARINIKLDLHTGGAQKKMELPLKLLVMGDYSNGQEQRPLSEREKLNINKNNFNSVLAEFQPSLTLAVPDGGCRCMPGHCMPMTGPIASPNPSAVYCQRGVTLAN